MSAPAFDPNADTVLCTRCNRTVRRAMAKIDDRGRAVCVKFMAASCHAREPVTVSGPPMPAKATP